MGSFLAPGPTLMGWTVYRREIPLSGALYGVTMKPLQGSIGGRASIISLSGTAAEKKLSPACKLGAMIGSTKYSNTCLSDLIIKVRRRMNDFARANRLLGEVEASDGAIFSALSETLERINDTTPYSLRWACEQFPAKTLLLDGAILLILEALIYSDIRNTVQYDAAGMSATEFGKYQAYMQLYSMKMQQWSNNVEQFKIEYNYNLAWGGVIGYGFSQYVDFWSIGY